MANIYDYPQRYPICRLYCYYAHFNICEKNPYIMKSAVSYLLLDAHWQFIWISWTILCETCAFYNSYIIYSTEQKEGCSF